MEAPAPWAVSGKKIPAGAAGTALDSRIPVTATGREAPGSPVTTLALVTPEFKPLFCYCLPVSPRASS